MKTATDQTSEPRADSAGFHALFDESFERMKRLAFLLGADDPENIAQEAFVRLHGKWPSLAPDKVLPYLRRTVVNLSRSRLRHLRVVRRAPREPDRDIASAEATVLAGHGNRAVHEAMQRLTPRQRQVLVLRYWLDLDQQAIAETLGIAVGTVKATTSHAMTALRAALPEEDDR
ncbi:MAG: sigma-70 family RNA polymerase sigma factor [Actinophytocola sp.]|uniref:RNA polymerase sigma factor n=1 Tax=Actinophytocola sp. TaxID=1872138 RepID=UPI003C722D67